MADSTTASSILNKTHPSSLPRTSKALGLLLGGGDGEDATKKKSTTMTATCTARQMLPLIPCQPTSEKPFFQTPFNTIDSTTETYESPWDREAYTGREDSCTKSTGGGGNNKKRAESSSKLSPAMQSDVDGFQDAANEVWDAYRQLYYGHDAVGSVFVRPTKTATDASPALEAVFAVSKKVEDGSTAQWQSVHIVQVGPPDLGSTDKTCDYTVDSAVWCDLHPAVAAKGQKYYSDTAARIDLSSLLTKSTSRTCKLLKPDVTAKLQIPVTSHIENIGSLIEQVEADIRSQMERVSMPKTTEVAQSMWREPGRSATVHLVTAAEMAAGEGDGAAEFGFATGMGVGKNLIGEIATRAKSKGLGEHDENGTKRSSVAEHMAVKQLARKESIKKDSDAAANELSDVRKGLKNTSNHGPSKANDGGGGGSSGSGGASTAVPTSQAPSSPSKMTTASLTPSAASPSTNSTPKKNPYGDIRASLKKSGSGLPTSPAFVPKSPTPSMNAATPEFMNFRSKLKSPVASSPKPKVVAPVTSPTK
mmetsp:Transcript_8821/g.22190  ORF Transcript_8821/g.22190 Transcript_8821/m.22190 type:complete len:534 (-) Transcript_8821:79-1680(-)